MTRTTMYLKIESFYIDDTTIKKKEKYEKLMVEKKQLGTAWRNGGERKISWEKKENFLFLLKMLFIKEEMEKQYFIRDK